LAGTARKAKPGSDSDSDLSYDSSEEKKRGEQPKPQQVVPKNKSSKQIKKELLRLAGRPQQIINRMATGKEQEIPVALTNVEKMDTQ